MGCFQLAPAGATFWRRFRRAVPKRPVTSNRTNNHSRGRSKAFVFLFALLPRFARRPFSFRRTGRRRRREEEEDLEEDEEEEEEDEEAEEGSPAISLC